MKKLMFTILSIVFAMSIVNAHELEEKKGGFNPAVPVMTKLSDGVYQYFQFFYNSLVVITDEGVVVSDPSGVKRATDMRAEIKKITDKPVVKVIYSHDHFDHSRGGQIFKDEGAEFIIHENGVELLERDKYLFNEAVMADITYKDKYRLTIGGKVIDLLYYGKNDGDAMSVIYMPNEKLVFAVDWHLQGYVNETHRLNTHDYLGMLNTLKRVHKELEIEKVISGHMAFSNPELLKEDMEFVQDLFDAVFAGLKAGKSVDELKKTVKLPKYRHWRGYEKNLSGHVERMAYSIWHGR